MFIGGGVGGIGRIGGGAGGRRGGGLSPSADFTLSGTSAVTAWNSTGVFGDLVASGVVPGSVRFVLVGETAGLAVINGGAE